MSETGKQRRSRIELGYYRRPDAAARRRGRLVLLALVAAGAWVAAAPAWEGGAAGVRLFQQSRLASRGPLAGPHAMWDSSCEACHVPFAPMSDSRWRPALAWSKGAADRKCQTCHAGPPHHKNQLERDVPSCAECHKDHRGRDSSLLAMADAVCTSCHGDLERHADPSAGTLATAAHATEFDADPAHHPVFTPPPSGDDSSVGRILFSHGRHMAEGLVSAPGGAAFRYGSLEPADRERYGWSAGRDGAPVQLRCDSCHRLEVTPAAATPELAQAIVPAANGVMQPVRYERDCRACHPLDIDPKAPDRRVRHGLAPSVVADDLRRYYTAQAVLAEPTLLGRYVPARPMPGRPAPAQAEQAGKAADEKTLIALKRLFGTAAVDQARGGQDLPLGRGGCVECHEFKTMSRPLVDLEAAAGLAMKPVVARSTWYESAWFNHTPHRALECASCHPGATEAGEKIERILPKIEDCTGCHAPARTRNGRAEGGAGMSCVLCHRYHNGDEPGGGLAATARMPAVPMTLEQFLSGGPTQSRDR